MKPEPAGTWLLYGGFAYSLQRSKLLVKPKFQRRLHLAADTS